MANTAEGITVGEQAGLDPNNPADFAAIMEGRGVAKTEEDTSSPDTSIASGLTTAAAGPEPVPPARDPDTGRFVSNQERAAQVVQPQATDTSGEEQTGDFADDPEIAAFLEKYDGDPVKALKGAANAQALIGRRDEEREALARQVAELSGQVQGLMAGGGRQQPAAPALSNDQVAEIAATRIETLGYEGAATEAANAAHSTGDERALATIIEQWQLESPYAAINFMADFKAWQREQAKPQPEATETPLGLSWAEEQAKVGQYGQGLLALKTELGDEGFAAVASKLDDALDQMPPNVLAMIDSADPEARDAGFRIVADRALRLAAAAPTVATPTAQAAAERKLAGARVASGALRPAAKQPDAPTNREDAIKEFKRQIVEAPTTNIASGLTYGPQP